MCLFGVFITCDFAAELIVCLLVSCSYVEVVLLLLKIQRAVHENNKYSHSCEHGWGFELSRYEIGDGSNFLHDGSGRETSYSKGA